MSWCSKCFRVLLVILLCAILSACTLSRPVAVTPTVIVSNTATPTLTPSPTPTIEPSATPTSSPTATLGPTPASLTSSQIFEMVSPSVAFLETPTGTGSGVLIGDGYIVTNYHVVWPYEKVRVVFPDGTEYQDAPVLNWDPLSDLAVIGPFEMDSSPLEFGSGEGLAIGSEVLLIGYPSEVDEFPQPTITRGLISRLREWEQAGVTYFQTDATIRGGQSGGVLVSGMGEVIGISGFSFDYAGFGLAASTSDLVPRVESLIAGDDLVGLGQRRIPSTGGQKSHSFVTLEHEWDKQVYVINEPIGTEVEIQVDGGEDDVAMVVLDVVGGTAIYADDGVAGIETGAFTTGFEAPYFVKLFQYAPYPTDVSVEADHELIPYVDLDDNRGLPRERAVYGSLDYPGDDDRFLLVLDKGEWVNILVDSTLISPYLTVGRPGDGEEHLVSDYASGGGLFGENAELTFVAPESDVYLVIIEDAPGDGTGAYSVLVREPYAEAPTPASPSVLATPILSDFGPMAVYESFTGPFRLLYPATWTDNPASLGAWQRLCGGASACYIGDSLLVITEESLAGLGDFTLDDYIALSLTVFENSGYGIRAESREGFTTSQGLTGKVLTLDIGGLFRARRFVFFDGDLAFNATYLVFDDEGEALLPLFEYSFSTFEVID